MDLTDSWYGSLEGASACHEATTYRGTQGKKREHISMPLVRFEPKISAFDRAKTSRALDSTAFVIGEC
jgi:hypothetical protein